MKEILENNSCSFGADVLAYLYDEMPAPDRDALELHLADCGTCTDDFAELAQARFPVYEWKKLAFEPLRTPNIVIPYTEVSQASWFAKLKAAFSFNPALSTGGAFAALLVFFGIGYAVFVQLPSDGEDIVKATPRVVTASPEISTMVVATAPSQADVPMPPAGERSDGSSGPVRQRNAIPARATERKPMLTNNAKSGSVKKTPDPRPSLTVPILSAVEDDEDESLRLADMLDEIGTSE